MRAQALHPGTQRLYEDEAFLKEAREYSLPALILYESGRDIANALRGLLLALEREEHACGDERQVAVLREWRTKVWRDARALSTMDADGMAKAMRKWRAHFEELIAKEWPLESEKAGASMQDELPASSAALPDYPSFDAIMEELFENAPREPDPITIFVGGLPGAGTERVSECMAREYPGHIATIISADDLRIYHPDFVRLLLEKPAELQAQTDDFTANLVARAIDFALENNISFVIESSWSDSSALMNAATRSALLGRKNYAALVGTKLHVNYVLAATRYFCAGQPCGLWTDTRSIEESEAHIIKTLDAIVSACTAPGDAEGLTHVESPLFESLLLPDRDLATDSYVGRPAALLIDTYQKWGKRTSRGDLRFCEIIQDWLMEQLDGCTTIDTKRAKTDLEIAFLGLLPRSEIVHQRPLDFVTRSRQELERRFATPPAEGTPPTPLTEEQEVRFEELEQKARRGKRREPPRYMGEGGTLWMSDYPACWVEPEKEESFACEEEVEEWWSLLAQRYWGVPSPACVRAFEDLGYLRIREFSGIEEWYNVRSARGGKEYTIIFDTGWRKSLNTILRGHEGTVRKECRDDRWKGEVGFSAEEIAAVYLRMRELGWCS